MTERTYRAPTIRDALSRVRKDLGHEALILGIRQVHHRPWYGGPTRDLVEVVATREPFPHFQPPTSSLGQGKHDPTNPPPPSSSHTTTHLGTLREAVELLSREGRVDLFLPEIPTAFAPAYAYLLDRDVPEPIARRLSRRLADLVDPSEPSSPDSLFPAMILALEQVLPVAPPIRPAPGLRRVLALIGPTGSGKTTTVAKIAVTAKIDQGLRVALLTLDANRIGGADRLKTYAEIIDLPLLSVSSPDQLTRALHDLSPFDLVLIDTPGAGPRDRLRLLELSALLAAAQPDETHLVLPASVGESPIRAFVEAFSSLRPDRLLLSKLDEAERPGAILAAPGPAGLPFSFLATGQFVPDDLEPACPNRLARLILGLDQPQCSPEYAIP